MAELQLGSLLSHFTYVDHLCNFIEMIRFGFVAFVQLVATCPCKDRYPHVLEQFKIYRADNSSFELQQTGQQFCFLLISLQVIEEILDESSHSFNLLFGQLLLQFHEMAFIEKRLAYDSINIGKLNLLRCAVFWIFFKQDIRLVDVTTPPVSWK